MTKNPHKPRPLGLVKPFYQDNLATLFLGDCRDVLRELPEESVQAVVTSPPYLGLRTYEGIEPSVWGGEPECEHEWQSPIIRQRVGWESTPEGQKQFKTRNADSKAYRSESCYCSKCGAWYGNLGNEPTIEQYVANMVEVFRGVRRVLRKDSTCFLNMGDSYASGKGSCFNPGGGDSSLGQERKEAGVHPLSRGNKSELTAQGLKPKDLCLIPARVALALQADGWWVRSEIIWAKGSCMPESVRDRPTKSHEQIYLLSKSANYFYDADAVREPLAESTVERVKYGWFGEVVDPDRRSSPDVTDVMGDRYVPAAGRNLRDVWHINPEPFPGSHFAVFPRALVTPCILAGTSEAGCCPDCGSPWERVVERTEPVPTGKGGSRKMVQVIEKYRGETSTATSCFETGAIRHSITTGFRPTCKCPEHEPIPCTVLDPFAGASTTLLRARELGRKSIGAELSAEYCEISKNRLGGQYVMFAGGGEEVDRL
jgi:DNA modification methylase